MTFRGRSNSGKTMASTTQEIMVILLLLTTSFVITLDHNRRFPEKLKWRNKTAWRDRGSGTETKCQMMLRKIISKQHTLGPIKETFSVALMQAHHIFSLPRVPTQQYLHITPDIQCT